MGNTAISALVVVIPSNKVLSNTLTNLYSLSLPCDIDIHDYVGFVGNHYGNESSYLRCFFGLLRAGIIVNCAVVAKKMRERYDRSVDSSLRFSRYFETRCISLCA